ncbi:cytochrome P450 [Hypoxylon sp. FL1150]|nr:cytochrome P450 [Hypoxylon sp. FL1150]
MDLSSQLSWTLILQTLFALWVCGALYHKITSWFHYKLLFKKCGKTYEANRLGNRVIKTMNPELTKYTHATFFDHFGVKKIRSGAEYLWGDGITVVEGEKWAASRKLIKPSFDTRSLGTHVARLMGLIPRDASTVDLMPLFRRLSLYTASELIFGESLDALESPDSHEFLDAYFYAQRGTAWWRDCDIANDFLDKRVDEALVRQKKGMSMGIGDGNDLHLVDEMAKATQDRLTLRFQMQNVFTPAHYGAAITLSNAFFHLSRCPAAWAKLRTEILPTKDEPITYDLLKTYQYLKSVIRKTHRVTPISTLISRQCIKEVVFPSGGGKDGKAPLYLRKGDIYTSFGGGPRMCPGFCLVFAEVAYTMVKILREFERLESRDDRPWTEETRATFQNLYGTKVALFPAQDV